MKLKICAALTGLLCLACTCIGQIVPDYALRNADTTSPQIPYSHFYKGSYHLEFLHDTVQLKMSQGRVRDALEELVGWKEEMESEGDSISFDYAVVQLDLGMIFFQLGDYVTAIDLFEPLTRYQQGKSPVSLWAVQRLQSVQVFAGQVVSALNQTTYLFQNDSSLKANADRFDIHGMNLAMSEDSIYYGDAILLLQQVQQFFFSVRNPGNRQVIDHLIEFFDEMIRLGKFNEEYELNRTIDKNAVEGWIARLDRLGYKGATRNSAYIYGAEYLIRSQQVQLGLELIENLWNRMEWEMNQPGQTHFEAFPYLITNGVLMVAHAWTALHEPAKVVKVIDSYPLLVSKARRAILNKTGILAPMWGDGPELLIQQQLRIRACLDPQLQDINGALRSCEEFFRILGRLYDREQSDESRIWLIRTAYNTMLQVVKAAMIALNSPNSDIVTRAQCARVFLYVDSYKNRLINTQWLGTIRTSMPEFAENIDSSLHAVREQIARWHTIQVTDSSQQYEAKMAVRMLEGQEFRLLEQRGGKRKGDFGTNEVESIDWIGIREAMAPDEALLYYIEGFSQVYRFLIQKNSFRVDELPKPGWLDGRLLDGKAYEAQVLGLGESFLSSTQYQLRAAALRKWMWPWENPEEAPSKVSVFPDGYIWKLPFDGLVYRVDSTLQYSSLDYLLKHHEISYWPGLKIWLVSRDNSNYEPAEGLLSVAPAFLTARSPACDTSVPTIPEEPLPSILAANRSMAELYNGKFLLGDEATEGRMKSAMESASVLSIASHAFSNDLEPLASHIALYPNCDSTHEDGRLYAYEIFRKEIHAELVMLWGCSTGDGRHARGEGLLSLARAFIASGARSVLMSQWDMGEAATSKMMPLYFKHLANGLGKAEALRQAKLEFLETAGPLEADPHQWAGWALIGDDHHLQTVLHRKTMQPWNWALAASCGMCLVFALGLLRKRRKRTN